MVDYVFDGIFDVLTQFISLRLPMNSQNTELMRRILKLCLMSA